jgi:hypothetical protein
MGRRGRRAGRTWDVMWSEVGPGFGPGSRRRLGAAGRKGGRSVVGVWGPQARKVRHREVWARLVIRVACLDSWSCFNRPKVTLEGVLGDMFVASSACRWSRFLYLPCTVFNGTWRDISRSLFVLLRLSRMLSLGWPRPDS